MARRKKRPVGRPRKHPADKRPKLEKEVKTESKRQTWAKFFSLPFEVVDIIFKYAAPLDYWTYRIFREFERFRQCLDPVYFVQTNVQLEKKLFRVPPDQNEEDFKFNYFNDFVNNVNRVAEKYNYRKQRHIFIEMEVESLYDNECLMRILRYLQSEQLECSLFLRSTSLSSSSVFKNLPILNMFRELKNDVCLYEQSKLILDSNLATSIQDFRYKNETLQEKCKFLEYPKKLTIREKSGVPFSWLLLKPKNVVFKKTVENLTSLQAFDATDIFKNIHHSLFQNLKILDLAYCGNRNGRLNVNKITFPHLEKLIIDQCDLVSFSHNSLPKLISLNIIEDRKEVSSKLAIINNNFSRLESCGIRATRAVQLFGNTFSNDMKLFEFDAPISDEGSFGDLPEVISKVDSLVLDLSNVSKEIINDLFNELYDLKKLRKLQIFDPHSQDLKYIENKTFDNLELLELSDLRGSGITNIPKLNMPSLKILRLLDSRVETVNTQDLKSLEAIIFSGVKRGGFDAERDSLDDKYVINISKTPKSSRAINIDLRFHKSYKFSETDFPLWTF